jgi:hypothetical protein
MIFSTSIFIPVRSKPIVLAFMLITVIMQVANEVAIRSVGENLSPLPLLSTGASVSKLFVLRKWVQVLLNSPL